MPRSGQRFGDVKKDLTIDELAGIGTLTIAFNDLEFELDILVAVLINVPGSLLMDVVKRLRGLEDKIELAKISIDHWQNLLSHVQAPEDYHFSSVSKSSLGSFNDLKKCRDIVVHSRVYDNVNKIGGKIGYKAQHDQVLLTQDALEWVYSNILKLTAEFNLIRNYVSYIMQSFVYQAGPFPVGIRLSHDFIGILERIRDSQRARAALGPAPKFPESSN